jgi:hypothetical protein
LPVTRSVGIDAMEINSAVGAINIELERWRE